MMLPARIRSESGWSDACILNLSSKGLLVYSNATARPGTFVEIRRGRELVVARVVWRKNQRIGLCSPDKVRILDLIGDGNSAAASLPAAAPVERRIVPRIAPDSRARARATEFLSTVLISAFFAGCAAVYVLDVVRKPLATVRQALGAH